MSLWLWSLSCLLWSRAPEAPSADQLFARHASLIYRRIGPEELHSARVEMEVELVGQSLRAPMLAEMAEPDWSVVHLDLPGVGRSSEGVVVGRSWVLDALTGPRWRSGPEAAQAVAAADVDFAARWPAHYPSREVVGVEDYEGEACWRVEAQGDWGAPVTLWFSRAQGLIVGQLSETHTALGPVPVRTVFGGWRELDGLLVPTRVELWTGPSLTLLWTRSYDANPEPPVERRLPPEVEALPWPG